jgi:fructokinase
MSATPTPAYRIGIDLGGTKIEGVALDARGAEVVRRRIDTEADGGPEHIVSRIAGLYAGLVYFIDDTPHTLGIGTPGAVSAKTGLLKNSNTVCLNGLPLPSMLEAALHHPLRVENDANCFALAEALQGAGVGHGLVFGVILGTGCGGGIVIDGKPRTGPQALAGEWGHMVIDPAGDACFCGARGCVETFISGSGLERRFRNLLGRRGASTNDPRRRWSASRIHQGFQDGDVECALIMDEYFERFGQAVANLIAVLDPDIIVLGGGLSHIDRLYTRGIAEVEKHVFNDELTTPIVRNQLGDSAGVVGAALIGV